MGGVEKFQTILRGVESGILASELEALEILTKAGRVATNVEWTSVIGAAGDAIVTLAEKIKEERGHSELLEKIKK